MTTLDEILDPITSAEFFADYHDRKPLHVPASASGSPARRPLDWPGFNALLDQTSIWNAAHLRLYKDVTRIPETDYCNRVPTQDGQVVLRPSPAKVQVCLADGASLVANEVQFLNPAMSAVADVLSRRFAALVGANVYCSFHGVRAFGTHFDSHDVWAFHLEGEKVWRVYQNRADNPHVFPPDSPEARRWVEATRGPVMHEIRMKPGDLLYLPRGWYHDALADGGASLHLTYSVTPLDGRALLGVLAQTMVQDSAFRAFLPPAHADDGQALAAHLADLARRLADQVSGPAMLEEMMAAQARLSPRIAPYALPQAAVLTFYRVTGLHHPIPPGPMAAPVRWMFAQPTFAVEDLLAEFEGHDPDRLRQIVETAVKAGALALVK